MKVFVQRCAKIQVKRWRKKVPIERVNLIYSPFFSLFSFVFFILRFVWMFAARESHTVFYCRLHALILCVFNEMYKFSCVNIYLVYLISFRQPSIHLVGSASSALRCVTRTDPFIWNICRAILFTLQTIYVVFFRQDLPTGCDNVCVCVCDGCVRIEYTQTQR